MTAAEIGEESSKNRMMGDPHLKSMVAKDGVNQASALVLTRWETAQSRGRGSGDFSPRSRDRFRAAGPEPTRHRRIRGNVCCLPQRFGGAGIDAEQIGAADLYSCFPIAVGSDGCSGHHAR